MPLLRRDVLELLSAVGLGYVFIFCKIWHRQSTCATCTSGVGLNGALVPVTAAWASKFKHKENCSMERKEFDNDEMSDKWTFGPQLTK